MVYQKKSHDKKWLQWNKLQGYAKYCKTGKTTGFLSLSERNHPAL